jgi:hypothetical protein
MHQASSIKTTLRGASTPFSGFSAMTGLPLMAASRATPCAPPGGHWLMSAWSLAIASA